MCACDVGGWIESASARGCGGKDIRRSAPAAGESTAGEAGASEIATFVVVSTRTAHMMVAANILKADNTRPGLGRRSMGSGHFGGRGRWPERRHRASPHFGWPSGRRRRPPPSFVLRSSSGFSRERRPSSTEPLSRPDGRGDPRVPLDGRRLKKRCWRRRDAPGSVVWSSAAAARFGLIAAGRKGEESALWRSRSELRTPSRV